MLGRISAFRIKPLVIFQTVLVLTFGCVKHEFVVLRAVPENPSFVVISANNSLAQVEFANIVEEAILSTGVKLINKPGIREIETEKTSVSPKLELEIEKGEARVKESYLSYNEVDADYVVYTFLDNHQIKIVKKKTNEILTSFSIRNYVGGYSDLRDKVSVQVAKVLKTMKLSEGKRK